MKNNIIKEKSFSFAKRIVNMYKFLTEQKREFVLSKQLLRSGTSIGANIHEAVQGQSKKDFIAKLCISLKETSETEYWLLLLKETNYIDEKSFSSINDDCIELLKLLTSIIKTSRQNMSEE